MNMHVARVPAADAGRLELTQIEVREPGRGEVRIRVEACGICHSDALTVRNAFPGITYPRVPGHEIAGIIDALGEDVPEWQKGDRVGVGWHGGHCGYCARCRRGDFITCPRLKTPGIAYDGGYAEFAVVPSVALARIPTELAPEEAAPLLCAGVTTFNALRNSAARPGDLVAILGIGGLGHLGVQFAAKMGFDTVAIARGPDKAETAKQLGARAYIDSQAANAGSALRKLGGAKVVLATATAAKAMAATLGGLAVDGQLLIVGVSEEPLELQTAGMIGRRQSVKAWPSGTAADSEDTMKFCVSSGVRAVIETAPLKGAIEAYERMTSGKARYRVVLKA